MTNGEYLQGTPVWILLNTNMQDTDIDTTAQEKCKHLNLKSKNLEVQEKDQLS